MGPILKWAAAEDLIDVNIVIRDTPASETRRAERVRCTAWNSQVWTATYKLGDTYPPRTSVAQSASDRTGQRKSEVSTCVMASVVDGDLDPEGRGQQAG